MTDDKAEQDPTADFLDGVRAEPAPWRTERPVEHSGEPVTYQDEAQPRSRARKAVDAARQAAPYLPLATYAGFLAADALTDDDPGQDPGFDFGADAGG